jgi:pentatricopeptide repeat protein
VVVAATP